jgi:hypothetical protein
LKHGSAAFSLEQDVITSSSDNIFLSRTSAKAENASSIFVFLSARGSSV